MRLAGGNVLAIKLLVEIDVRVDVLHDRMGAQTKASAPHFIAHDRMLMTPAPKGDSKMTLRPPASLQKIGRLRLFSALGALVILIVLAGIYGIARIRSNPTGAACQAAVNTAKRIAGLARGVVAAVTVVHVSFQVHDLAFKDVQGIEMRLADLTAASGRLT